MSENPQQQLHFFHGRTAQPTTANVLLLAEMKWVNAVAGYHGNRTPG